jgi:hypothetical protein
MQKVGNRFASGLKRWRWEGTFRFARVVRICRWFGAIVFGPSIAG